MELVDVGLALKRVQARHHREADAVLEPLGVTLVQWDALRHLHEHPNASLHELAQLTFQSDQSFGALAGRMIDRGLIERVPARGRAVRHRLTEAGDLLRGRAQVEVERMLQRSMAPLSTEELAQLAGFLTRLNDEAAART